MFFGIQRENRSLEWHIKAAKLGDANSQCYLGLCALNNVEKYPNNKYIALFWFKKAAQNGHSKAVFYLANMYENGIGVEKNIAVAIKLYQIVVDCFYHSDTYFFSQSELKIKELT